MTTRPILMRLLREPLLHFLVIGGVIFAFLSTEAPSDPVDGGMQIVISSADVDRMATAWAQRWQRPATAAEMDGMLREAVREQVLYREALSLGLDRDDVVIRRHLRQKYEFLTQDLAYDANPDDATLRAYYEAKAERYTRPGSLSFSQILFSTDRRGQTAETDAVQALAQLQGATAPDTGATLGDATGLPPSVENLGASDVEAMFGPQFAQAVLAAEPGRWAGPVTSGFGHHLVWVSKRTPGSRIAFDDIKQTVKDDWVYEQRTAANEAVYQKVLERYEVVIEATAPASDSGS